MSSKPYYGLLEWDGWMAAAYGIGQGFSFCVWLAFGLVLLSRYGLDLSGWTFKIPFILGAIGSYYYGLRSYQQKVKA